MKLMDRAARKTQVARELGQGLVLVAISGTSVGGFLGMVAVASRALGR
jgi:hypothetical protein